MISHNYLVFRMNPLKLKSLRKNKKNLLDRDIKDILKIKIMIDHNKSVPIHQKKKNSLKIPYLIKIWPLLTSKRKLIGHRKYTLSQTISLWLRSRLLNLRDNFNYFWRLKLRYPLFNRYNLLNSWQSKKVKKVIKIILKITSLLHLYLRWCQFKREEKFVWRYRSYLILTRLRVYPNLKLKSKRNQNLLQQKFRFVNRGKKIKWDFLWAPVQHS